MRRTFVEPGLLAIFRFSLLVQWTMIAVSLHVHGTTAPLKLDPGLAFAITSAGILLLLAYLSWRRLENRMGRLYLPVALIASAVFSLALQDILVGVHVEPGQTSSEELAWQLFLFLFIPVVLIAWQYNLKAVFAYCLLTAVLDYVLMSFTHADFQQLASTYRRLAFIRALSFAIAGYVIVRIMRQVRDQRGALERANRALAGYAATLEQLTISRERNRIARELHDTLAHTLSGIAVQLEAAETLWQSDPAEAHGMVSRSLEMSRSGLTDVRRALQDLRATPLEDLGLSTALRILASDAAQRFGMRLDWCVPEELPKLPPDVEQGIYRVAQEAVANVGRHAAARTLRVGWTAGAAGLVLAIEDDGCGFSPDMSGTANHYGLRGMAERAAMMGGKLDVVSQPGRGTSVRLSLKGC